MLIFTFLTVAMDAHAFILYCTGHWMQPAGYLPLWVENSCFIIAKQRNRTKYAIQHEPIFLYVTAMINVLFQDGYSGGLLYCPSSYVILTLAGSVSKHRNLDFFSSCWRLFLFIRRIIVCWNRATPKGERGSRPRCIVVRPSAPVWLSHSPKWRRRWAPTPTIGRTGKTRLVYFHL